MDTPLLALTRRRQGGLPGRSPKEAAAENMRQLIQLRWIAAAGQLVAILVAHFGLGVPLPLAAMLAVIATLAVANLLFSYTLRRLWVVDGELFLALLLDMGALTAQFYLSGGATNPFISLYLLQIVLGAILLTPWMAGLLVAVACLSYALLATNNLPLLLPESLWDVSADLRLIGEWISFAMVATLLVLFITRISHNLHARDTYVAELNQRATEEDAIVRMGLFASGAAHELSTPLSSLSVLVADWQRSVPSGEDPQFAEELAEAQAEVARCKDIVSNILHSAGRVRGEAMRPAPIAALLDGIAAEWQQLHPAVPLHHRRGPEDGALAAAEPALRQAIWNLLENAAEVSPAGIMMMQDVAEEHLVISVMDRGPGFLEEQLHSIGRLYQSSKGPGHGLGLFLAGNVARRLGGRLEAENRRDGGAVVRLVLPLVSISAEQEG